MEKYFLLCIFVSLKAFSAGDGGSTGGNLENILDKERAENWLQDRSPLASVQDIIESDVLQQEVTQVLETTRVSEEALEEAVQETVGPVQDGLSQR